VADKPADAAPPKSKKLLLIVGVVVLVLVLAGAGFLFFINQQRAASDDGEQEAAVHAEVGAPPTYLPLDNMVVNLADPGGEKVAQIGITLELIDAKAVEKVKQYLPTIRSSVLLLVSQRTAEELLQREGKEKLAKDILREASRPFGGGDEEEEEGADQAAAKKPKTTKRPKPRVQMPVTGVLFSSFIVQ
jgi:flagellar protein FliL